MWFWIDAMWLPTSLVLMVARLNAILFASHFLTFLSTMDLILFPIKMKYYLLPCGYQFSQTWR
jgi:hypothetical protein